MAPNLYRQLRTARDQHGVAPDASDGVLMLVAQSRSYDPTELASLLAEKGLTLDPSSLAALASVVRASAVPDSSGEAPPDPAGSAAPADDAMSFLQRVDHEVEDRYDDGAGPVPQVDIGPGTRTLPAQADLPDVPQPVASARRKNRRGLSPAHEAQLAAQANGRAPQQELVGPADNGASPAPSDLRSGGPDGTATTGTDSAAGTAATFEPDAELYSDLVDVWSARENTITFRRSAEGELDLSWPTDGSPGGPLVYLVVGADAAVPGRPSDGSRLVLTTSARAQVPAGSGPYFSVFEYSAPSVAGLPSAAPVHHAAGRQVPEVTELRTSTHPDAVMLTWTAPQGVDRVRVMRGREGQRLPPSFDPSLEIPAGSGFARDTDVLPGRRYEYRVLTEFVSSTGQSALSSGLDVSTEIPATPEPVTALDAVVTGEPPTARVDLRWPTPPLGRVVIYQSATVPQHGQANQVITMAELETLELGDRVGEPAFQDDATTVITGLPFSLNDGPRRAYTPVTLIGNQAAVGTVAVVNLLGSVTQVQLIERVDWQLLRFAWPAGATFAFVEKGAVGAGPDRTQPIQVSHEDYVRQGGLRMQLPVDGCDVHVRGAVHFGVEWTTGPVATVTYPGRWVLRYRFERVGLMGRRSTLQIRLDRSWRDVRLALTHRDDRLPLSYYDSPEPPYPMHLEGPAVTAGEWHPVEEVALRPDGFTRLFAYLEGASPIVIDPPMAPAPREAAPEPLGAGEVRCVRCMSAQPELPQLFRCVGRCAPQPDPTLSAFLGEPTTGRPLFTGGPARAYAAACPTCHVPSEELICKACHSVMPPQSTGSDPVSLTVVGARGTGKTTYLVSLLDFLEYVWGPATGAAAAPLDSFTTGRIRLLRERLRGGRTPDSTTSVEQNPDLLSPMLMGLDEAGGRQRALVLYDVAGEDVEQPDKIRPYGPTLATSDALLFLFDPLQLTAVRNLLEGQIPLPPVAGDPLVVLKNVIREIRHRTGAQRIDVPVAVGLSKLDGIHQAVWTPGTGLSDVLNGGSALMYDPTPAGTLRLDPSDRRRTNEETKSLLLWLGATQFVTQIESTFSRVEYFAVSALGHAPAGGTALSKAGISSFRIADPLRWLVDRQWPGTGR